MNNLTSVERARRQGFERNLRERGRDFSTDTDEALRAIVQDAQQLPDDTHPAKQKKPVYSIVTCLAGAVADPRAIGVFTETATGKTHTVLFYDETTGDRVTWKFQCEAQRENYQADESAQQPGF